MPLASKETIVIDSHRPLYYENKIDIVEEMGARRLEEREDRIRTITANEDETAELKHSWAPLQQP